MNNSCTAETAHQNNLSRIAAKSLKSCPLCHALNAQKNAECFSCRWTGEFCHEPDVIKQGLDSLIETCPELKEALKTRKVRKRKKPSLLAWARLCLAEAI